MKHLLSAKDLTHDEAVMVLDTAEAMAATQSRAVKKLPTLRGKTVVNLFFEDSTRTRLSFEAAAKRLSADVINFSAKGSSLSKGESLKDTAQTIMAMGADAVVVRHSACGAAHLLAHAGWINVPVLNAGDGTHQHPTQALLDMFSMEERFGSLEGLRVAIVGDVTHSRVARSNIYGLGKMGAKVVVAGPATLMPVEIESLGCEATCRVDDAIRGADVVMGLRIQLERQKKGLFPSVREYHKFFGLTEERIALARKDALVMHPGPINRGVEIASDVADGPQSVIDGQVTNGVAVRMALLYLLTRTRAEAGV